MNLFVYAYVNNRNLYKWYYIFFGWKFFYFIIILKDFEIPYISEVEIILLSFIIKNKKFISYLECCVFSLDIFYK
jgi:hypothetical protein